MWKALQYKFDQHPKLMKLLQLTKGRWLVEHALDDEHYGCGRDNKGLNMLGRMLMDLRDGTRLRDSTVILGTTSSVAVDAVTLIPSKL
jgi:predicted NAD-dependent protein-ADP-ribosyltransferase YbiA (DUF1768 family)